VSRLNEPIRIAGPWLMSFAILAILSCWPIFARFEAKAYTRITGIEVTTYDAMFLQLRVQECPVPR